MKKVLSVILSVTLLLSAIAITPVTAFADVTDDSTVLGALVEEESVSASSGTTGDCTWTLDEDGVLTISGNGNMGSYSAVQSTGASYITTAPWGADIKSVVIEDGVTNIGFSAFYGCTGLTSVILGNSVKNISLYAFADCTGLTSVTIPDSVTSINGSAFSGCTGLTELSVSENNTAYDSRNNCNAIINTATNTLMLGCENTVIPDGVTSISSGAFQGLKGLKSITIPDSVTNIGSSAFYGCTGLTSVNIPDSVTSIGNYAFVGCTGLTELSVSENNTVYDSRNNCNAIIKTATNTLLFGCQNTVIPNGVTSIGNYAFYGCTGLTSIVIPDSVTSIGESAFEGCKNLSSVSIGNGVTSISNYAFKDCRYLTSVTIPDSVTSIGRNAFYGCYNLSRVKLGNSIESIGDNAFRNCNRLKSVFIPDSVTNIGSDAFPNSTTFFGNNYLPISGTTGDCTWSLDETLTTLTISGNGEMGNYDSSENAPWKLSGISKAVIEDGVTSIGNYAFSGCTGLTSVTIPDSVTSIGDYAFSGCTYLNEIIGGNGITVVGMDAFNNCPAKIAFGSTGDCSWRLVGSTLTISGDGAMGNYDSTYYNGSWVTTVSSGAQIRSVVIENGVTNIGDYAFIGCYSLSNVTLGNSVTSIGDHAF